MRRLLWLTSLSVLIACGGRTESSIGTCLEAPESETLLWSEQGWIVGKSAFDGPWILEVRSTAFSAPQTLAFEWEISRDLLLARSSGQPQLAFPISDHWMLGQDGEGSCVLDTGPLCSSGEEMYMCTEPYPWHVRSGAVVNWSTLLLASPQLLHITEEMADEIVFIEWGRTQPHVGRSIATITHRTKDLLFDRRLDSRSGPASTTGPKEVNGRLACCPGT